MRCHQLFTNLAIQMVYRNYPIFHILVCFKKNAIFLSFLERKTKKSVKFLHFGVSQKQCLLKSCVTVYKGLNSKVWHPFFIIELSDHGVIILACGGQKLIEHVKIYQIMWISEKFDLPLFELRQTTNEMLIPFVAVHKWCKF